MLLWRDHSRTWKIRMCFHNTTQRMFACRSISLITFKRILIHQCQILRKCWWCVIHSMTTLFNLWVEIRFTSIAPLHLPMPWVSTLDGRIWNSCAANWYSVTRPCDTGSVILSYSSDKMVIFSTYGMRSSTVHVFLPCGDTMYCNVSATSACNY